MTVASPHVRAVFLDVDDTLVDWATASRASLAEAVGAGCDHDLWLRLDHYERYLAGELDFQTMRDTRMADYLRLLGREADVPRAAAIERTRFDGAAARCTLFEDVLPCLAELRERGMILGLITNNSSAHQREKLAATGLDTLFDAIAISGEVGVAKPDRAIFAHACRLAGVEAAEAVHVGDNLVADVQGAQAAGLRGVWLNRHGREVGPDITAISGLGELAGLLA